MIQAFSVCDLLSSDEFTYRLQLNQPQTAIYGIILVGDQL